MAILGKVIEFIRGANVTPIVALYSALGFILFLTVYHWSGASEKIENLTTGKKLLAFIFVAMVLAGIYYILFKAGKFDAILDYLPVKKALKSII